MKILVFSIALLFFGVAEGGGIDPAVRAKVLGAKKQAIEVIQRYAEDSSNRDYQIATLMAQLLEKSKTIPAVGARLKECEEKPSLIAGVGSQSQIVVLCPYALSNRVDQNKLMQTFIHESYHLYDWAFNIPQNYRDILDWVKLNPDSELEPKVYDEMEYRAAAMEMQIMKGVLGCIYFSNSYFQRLLGYKENKDYVICK